MLPEFLQEEKEKPQPYHLHTRDRLMKEKRNAQQANTMPCRSFWEA